MENYKIKYYNELFKNFKNKNQVLAEIINLRAIMNLPKGTEHFVSDIHGEYEMFIHILRTASGVIKRKISEEFGKTLTSEEMDSLASLIYYPEEKLKLIEKNDNWYRITLYKLIRVAKYVAGKYTRSKVRKMLPQSFAYIMDELLNCDSCGVNKEKYYDEIIDNVINLKLADNFFIELCNLIQSMAIDHLHIVGDIFDRGPRADIILDNLKSTRSIDIQWGNHDVLWIGAGLGDIGCILCVLVDCFKYGNIELLEDGYNINLLPIMDFVNDIYGDVDCSLYKTTYNTDMQAKVYKALSILRFKVEDTYKLKYPDFEMTEQTVLDKIDFAERKWCGYDMLDCNFPTVDPNNRTLLTSEEECLVKKLVHSFTNSAKLSGHINFMLAKGSLYLCYNNNLLFHGCIPLKENGEFLPIKWGNREYVGKEYLDYCESVIHNAVDKKDEYSLAFIWQLWCGCKSPVFGKDKMTTFERLYIADANAHKEVKQHYFNLQDSEEVCNKIFAEFNLDATFAHIVNGHIPVKHTKGESPIKANGKMLVIDGGMSKPYQKVTGIAGYTLTYNSYGMSIASHEPFMGKDVVISNNREMVTTKYVVNKRDERVLVKETDIGRSLAEQIKDCNELVNLIEKGIIKDKI